jgi:chaperonin cofactor prefoldin
MNKERRKQIEKLIEAIENAVSELESIQEEEQDYYDNVPENLQSGERYEASEAAIDSMDSAHTSFEEALDYLREIE